jgi:O-methyltransferase
MVSPSRGQRVAERAPIVYQPGVVRRLGGHVLQLCARGLPAGAYRMLYAVAFSVHRAALRAWFLRHRVPALVSGNDAAQRRTAAVHSVMPYSLVGWQGLLATYDAVQSVSRRQRPGALVECGVARGGSAALLALSAADAGAPRHLWLFDSFAGLPEPTAADFTDGRTGMHVRPLPPGSCLGTMEEVQHVLFDRFRLDRGAVTLVKGWFQDTLPFHAAGIGEVAVLRLDGDWYESTRCCLENLYPHVVSGGIVIIDDYGSCFGAQRAVDEFLDARGIGVELVPDGRGGCWFIKP